MHNAIAHHLLTHASPQAAAAATHWPDPPAFIAEHDTWRGHMVCNIPLACWGQLSQLSPPLSLAHSSPAYWSLWRQGKERKPLDCARLAQQ